MPSAVTTSSACTCGTVTSTRAGRCSGRRSKSPMARPRCCQRAFAAATSTVLLRWMAPNSPRVFHLPPFDFENDESSGSAQFVLQTR